MRARYLTYEIGQHRDTSSTMVTMTTRRAPRRAATGSALALVLLAASGCTTDGHHDATSAAPPSAADPVAAGDLVASMAQFRFDEGTRRLSAGVTNKGDRTIQVPKATLRWDGFAFPKVTVPDPVTQPGQTAAFTIAYGAPRCAQRPTHSPALVATVDGRVRRLPLHLDDPGLLGRLWTKACARERLDRAVDIRLRLGREVRRVAGEWSVPAEVVLRRRAGRERVELVDLGGSVLIELNPRGGRGALPGRLPGGRATLRFPVLFRSGHRCDAHALGQSSQTFLISAYLRLGSEPTQRVILPLSTVERDRLIGIVHRDCA
jgi:hypothetical protein